MKTAQVVVANGRVQAAGCMPYSSTGQQKSGRVVPRAAPMPGVRAVRRRRSQSDNRKGRSSQSERRKVNSSQSEPCKVRRVPITLIVYSDSSSVCSFSGSRETTQRIIILIEDATVELPGTSAKGRSCGECTGELVRHG